MPRIPKADRFKDAVDAFDEKMKDAHKRGDAAVASYATSYFSAEESTDSSRSEITKLKPLNLTFRGANVLVAQIAANEPRHIVKPRRLELTGEAMLHSLRLDYCNAELDRVNLSRRGLLNTLLRGRTVKRVGLRSGANLIKLAGRIYDPGQPFVKIVPNKKHIYDQTATERGAMRWEGERYTVSMERAATAGIFDKKRLEQVRPVWEGAGEDEVQTARMLGTGGPREREEYVEDMIELMDVVFYDPDGPWYLVTLPASTDHFNDYLRVEELDPLEHGMFLWEEFYPNPDDLTAVSWGDMTMVQTLIASRLMNKIVDDADNMKRLILAGMGVSQDEINSVMNAANRSVVQVNDPTQWNQVEFGGALVPVNEMVGAVLQWWNVQAGQIDQLSGSGGGSKTATQYSGDMANAQSVVGQIKQIHQEHEEKVSRAIAHYLMNDPTSGEMISFKLAGQPVQAPYAPLDMFRGRASDFEFKIRPASMPAQDPTVLLRRLIEFLSLPMVATAANPQATARIVGDFAGIDDLEEIIPDPQRDYLMASALNQMEGMPPPQPPVMPGVMPGGMPQPPMPGQMPMGVHPGAGAPMTANQQVRPIDAIRAAMTVPR